MKVCKAQLISYEARGSIVIEQVVCAWHVKNEYGKICGSCESSRVDRKRAENYTGITNRKKAKLLNNNSGERRTHLRL